MDSELLCACVCVCVCVLPCVCTCIRPPAPLHWISALPHPSLGPPSRFVQIPTHICESPGLQIKGEHS